MKNNLIIFSKKKYIGSNYFFQYHYFPPHRHLTALKMDGLPGVKFPGLVGLLLEEHIPGLQVCGRGITGLYNLMANVNTFGRHSRHTNTEFVYNLCVVYSVAIKQVTIVNISI